MALGQSYDHDDVIKWKHFPRYWSFVWGIHRSPANSPHKGLWHGALMFSLNFDLRLNKRLTKQSLGWWFETPLCPLWRHCNDHYRFCKSVNNKSRTECLQINWCWCKIMLLRVKRCIYSLIDSSMLLCFLQVAIKLTSTRLRVLYLLRTSLTIIPIRWTVHTLYRDQQTKAHR